MDSVSIRAISYTRLTAFDVLWAMSMGMVLAHSSSSAICPSVKPVVPSIRGFLYFTQARATSMAPSVVEKSTTPSLMATTFSTSS